MRCKDVEALSDVGQIPPFLWVSLLSSVKWVHHPHRPYRFAGRERDNLWFLSQEKAKLLRGHTTSPLFSQRGN